ncbi:sigma 54-interacting transcriptional regulator [Desulfobotulus sp. H1]|uniref:Sigma 54-interacting transcriptional regulator n=1 Tax=Desulfobotulus pelophilus TaxID=2823377 RepID=A0ABT3NCF7_9BACT|nr:sigma 54-interacting transcriptional regulator [Desulfobotulus pelophilus]MCW7754861.1 sigma 54-interacting transcriptional regulator [Desulfobotulus pelophilus]
MEDANHTTSAFKSSDNQSGSNLAISNEAYAIVKNIGTFPDLKNLIDFQRTIINYCACGLMVVDTEGQIIYVNDSFCEIHNISPHKVIGQHVTKIVDNTQLHKAAESGIAQHDCFQDISGKHYVVSRIPILKNGDCVGALGLIRFRYVEEVKLLTEKIAELNAKIKNLKEIRAVNMNVKYTFDDIIGSSEELTMAKEIAMQAATSDATILIRGPSGSGKEVFAHSIHNFSPRSSKPFIRINCSAIQENLIESELFGYEEGAFTGARRGGKKGKFELAHTGTILLDEIGDMPIASQVKLLRAIQEREISPVGSEKNIPVDVRIIASTNQPLEKLVEENRFRADLFYRLNVIPIIIPELKQTPEEIPFLSRKIWEELSKAHGIFHKTLSKGAVLALQSYDWPGNIRELRNILERLLIMVRKSQISENDVQRGLISYADYGSGSRKDDSEERFGLDLLVKQTEKQAVASALKTSGGNKSKAAKLLGISRPLLYKKIKKYQL